MFGILATQYEKIDVFGTVIWPADGRDLKPDETEGGEHRPSVIGAKQDGFENVWIQREEGTGGWRKFHIEWFYDFHHCQISLQWLNQQLQMSGACGTHGRQGKKLGLGTIQRRETRLEDTAVDDVKYY
jgi:hypothetical protein